MEKVNARFAQRLRRLRREKKLTQEELAYLAGIDYKHLQRLESKNPSAPTLATLEKLAKAFKISLSKFLNF